MPDVYITLRSLAPPMLCYELLGNSKIRQGGAVQVRLAGQATLRVSSETVSSPPP